MRRARVAGLGHLAGHGADGSARVTDWTLKIRSLTPGYRSQNERLVGTAEQALRDVRELQTKRKGGLPQ